MRGGTVRSPKRRRTRRPSCLSAGSLSLLHQLLHHRVLLLQTIQHTLFSSDVRTEPTYAADSLQTVNTVAEQSLICASCSQWDTGVMWLLGSVSKYIHISSEIDQDESQGFQYQLLVTMIRHLSFKKHVVSPSSSRGE